MPAFQTSYYICVQYEFYETTESAIMAAKELSTSHVALANKPKVAKLVLKRGSTVCMDFCAKLPDEAVLA
jgi:phosphoenolpyruvate-protein kinase (PTS system EI component)